MGKEKRKRLQVLRALQGRREQTVMLREGEDVWEVRAVRCKVS